MSTPELSTPSLHQAAQAVIDRWETPNWKDVPATATYIYALRDALEREKKIDYKHKAKLSAPFTNMENPLSPADKADLVKTMETIFPKEESLIGNTSRSDWLPQENIDFELEHKKLMNDKERLARVLGEDQPVQAYSGIDSQQNTDRPGWLPPEKNTDSVTLTQDEVLSIATEVYQYSEWKGANRVRLLQFAKLIQKKIKEKSCS